MDHPAHDLNTEAYRRLSPFEQIPSIDDDGLVLSESAAILVYLAKKSGRLIPGDRAGEAQVVRWCVSMVGDNGHRGSRCWQVTADPLLPVDRSRGEHSRDSAASGSTIKLHFTPRSVGLAIRAAASSQSARPPALSCRQSPLSPKQAALS